MNESSIKYSSAGNLVCLAMNKSYKITSFSIDETLLSKDQKELLEEMIMSSINEAVINVNELRKKSKEDDDNSEDNNSKKEDKSNLFNLKDMNQMFKDISKMTSVEYKDGKINISLDSINPDIISKMNDMINNISNKNDDGNNKE